VTNDNGAELTKHNVLTTLRRTTLDPHGLNVYDWWMLVHDHEYAVVWPIKRAHAMVTTGDQHKTEPHTNSMKAAFRTLGIKTFFKKEKQ
jgi:hypothetical protein